MVGGGGVGGVGGGVVVEHMRNCVSGFLDLRLRLQCVCLTVFRGALVRVGKRVNEITSGWKHRA